MVESKCFSDWYDFKEFIKPYKLSDCLIHIDDHGYYVMVDTIIGDTQ